MFNNTGKTPAGYIKKTSSNKKDSKNYESFSVKYGDFVQKTLYDQIHTLAAEKISSQPISLGIRRLEDKFEISKKEKKKQVKNQEADAPFFNEINNLITNFKDRVNLHTINYQLGYVTSRDGESTIVADYIGNGIVNVYIPQFNITKIDPATNELLYLQIVRYYRAGDLVNVISELRTRKETTFNFYQLSGQEATTPKDTKEFKTKTNNGKNLGDKISWDNFQDSSDEDFSDIETEPQTVKNPYGFIFAQHIENTPSPSLNFKGKPDIDTSKENLYTNLINETYVRIRWELELNKSKLIVNNENTTNFMEGQNTNVYNQWVSEGLILRNNDFRRPLGDTAGNVQYFETNNQNLQHLLSLWDYFIKKWWEKSGHHQSAADAKGKNLTEFEARLERYAEESRYAAKSAQMNFTYKHLIYKMIKVWMHHKDIKSKSSNGINYANIIVEMKPFTIINEKERIENEIIKIQSNLSDRQFGIKNISKVPLTDEEAANLAERYLNTNSQDIMEQLKQKPVNGSQRPQMSNPQGAEKSENKQNIAFYNQLEEKEK